MTFLYDLRLTHGQNRQRYTCAKCMKEFSSWTNFKRHAIEVHQEKGRFSCKRCDFKTNRHETLIRHAFSKHKSFWIVENILSEMIEAAVENVKKACYDTAVDILDEILVDALDASKAQGEDTNGSSTYEDEYLRIRDAHVAAIQAEFRRLYPTFTEELKSLRVNKKSRKASSSTVPKDAVRKSTRIRNKSTLEASPVDSSDEECHVGGEVLSVPVHEAESSQGEVAAHDEVMEDSSMIERALGKFACLPCQTSYRLVGVFFYKSAVYKDIYLHCYYYLLKF